MNVLKPRRKPGSIWPGRTRPLFSQGFRGKGPFADMSIGPTGPLDRFCIYRNGKAATAARRLCAAPARTRAKRG